MFKKEILCISEIIYISIGFVLIRRISVFTIQFQQQTRFWCLDRVVGCITENTGNSKGKLLLAPKIEFMHASIHVSTETSVRVIV